MVSVGLASFFSGIIPGVVLPISVGVGKGAWFELGAVCPGFVRRVVGLNCCKVYGFGAGNERRADTFAIEAKVGLAWCVISAMREDESMLIIGLEALVGAPDLTDPLSASCGETSEFVESFENSSLPGVEASITARVWPPTSGHFLINWTIMVSNSAGSVMARGAAVVLVVEELLFTI